MQTLVDKAFLIGSIQAGFFSFLLPPQEDAVRLFDEARLRDPHQLEALVAKTSTQLW